jgi:regulator of nucleoside diphosphate kinase
MNAKAAAPAPAEAKPALIIDAGLYARLLALAEQARKEAPKLADQLRDELERADLRAPEAMPADVVTIGSQVTFHDGERTQTVQVAFPSDADVDRGRVSVVTPLGAALLGLCAGQRISWEMGYRRVKVIEVLDVRR